jgi:hypothetical protein
MLDSCHPRWSGPSERKVPRRTKAALRFEADDEAEDEDD